MNSTRKRSVALFGLVAISLLGAACGSDDDKADDTTSSAAETTAAAEAPTTTGAAEEETTVAPESSEAETTEAPASSEEPASSEAPAAEVDYSALSGSLVGSGATFPKGFYDEAIATFADLASDLTIEYGGGGSGKGRSDLQEQVVDFAGTDSPVKDEDMPNYKGGEFVYVPTVVAPITVSYNLPDVDGLQLSPATIAGHLPAADHHVGRSRRSPPTTPTPRCRRPRSSSPAAPTAPAPPTTSPSSSTLPSDRTRSGEWTLGTGSELEWPDGTQAGDGNSGVAQIVAGTEGAIGYVDLSDAMANGLTFARSRTRPATSSSPRSKPPRQLSRVPRSTTTSPSSPAGPTATTPTRSPPRRGSSPTRHRRMPARPRRSAGS